MDISSYISTHRFDLIAKYLYIKYKDLDIKSHFYIDQYHAHLTTFNNCYEHLGTKTTIDETLP